MDIPANLLTDAYLWAGNLCYVLLILVALLTAPWSKVADSEAQHVYPGTIVLDGTRPSMTTGILKAIECPLEIGADVVMKHRGKQSLHPDWRTATSHRRNR